MINLPQEIKDLVSQTHQNNQTLVLVTGVFDLLHQEHHHFLEAAGKEGDILLVGLESDQRVKQIKGEGRPVNNEQDRLTNLNELSVVDGDFILPEDFHLVEQREALIKAIKPHILAASSHTKHLEEKQRIMQLVGGEMKVVYQHQPATSSTKMIHSA